MKFLPRSNQVLVLHGAEYSFESHPNACDMAFCSEGGRALVFKLKHAASSELFALKVFKHKFRNSHQSFSAQALSGFSSVRGMQAAKRVVIEPADPVVKTHPELEHAVLMPWVLATSWHDLLVRAARSSFRLQSRAALGLAAEFLGVMEELEKAGFAHTDISAANVMVDVGRRSVQLCDLEDAYFPGAIRPANAAFGTPGYRHGSGGVWGPCADRHASAVLAAEMLLLTSQATTDIGDTGLFAPVRGDPRASARAATFFSLGRGIAPNLTERIQAAFSSPSLEECPPLADLAAAARQDLEAFKDATPGTSAREGFSPPALPVPIVTWEPILPAASRGTVTHPRPSAGHLSGQAPGPVAAQAAAPAAGAGKSWRHIRAAALSFILVLVADCSTGSHGIETLVHWLGGTSETTESDEP